MIREFTIFCKLNFIKLSGEQLFYRCMQDFSKKNLPCPCCHAKHPIWDSHDDYTRNLISFENGIVVCAIISVTRLICSSCKRTHAVLPEIIVPHGSYSIIFILNVLRDYYLKTYRVERLCDKYQISTSTLYAWKRLFLLHKKLWLGVLEDLSISASTFLSGIPCVDFSQKLYIFFQVQSVSFMQGVFKTAHYGHT